MNRSRRKLPPLVHPNVSDLALKVVDIADARELGTGREAFEVPVKCRRRRVGWVRLRETLLVFTFLALCALSVTAAFVIRGLDRSNAEDAANSNAQAIVSALGAEVESLVRDLRVVSLSASLALSDATNETQRVDFVDERSMRRAFGALFQALREGARRMLQATHVLAEGRREC
mmetsp:Transcript_10104/g.31879  ORF Transcript_10104/g.31879 Transcript_10104/m.31879 type:complete len:174 (+) Transcript_10104:38-559(+)